MIFNRFFTKEDNKTLRKMIKEKRSIDEIRSFFGEKLFYHPSQKYYYQRSGTIPNFNKFIEEIKYQALDTNFTKKPTLSKWFNNQFDYHYYFQTNKGNRYVLDFIYLFDEIGPLKHKDLYNISFTLESQYNLDNDLEYEKITNLDEYHEIAKRLLFLLQDFQKNYGSGNYLISETTDIRKINWYRNLIKDSLNLKEIEGVSSFTNGLKAYYFIK